ncbi:PREDICTED: uncharacterized protein LOC109211327 [Nicotiana attenuata]|uniref:uncharacterized protein LOC109211327 n=1 Tax=Nicotiana attenuata TaxID=49451 RepID=UPI0009054371|nr:PREDICTED: uncharacterized protein LOC109211327 [Nicotiana attenuata]
MVEDLGLGGGGDAMVKIWWRLNAGRRRRRFPADGGQWLRAEGASQLETRDHLCAECDFTKAIWRKMQQWLQRKGIAVQTWNKHIEWAIHNAKGKSQQAQIFRIVYAECIYAIWMERNHRIFEKKHRIWEIIMREVAYICHVRSAPRVKVLIQSFIF